MIKFFPSDKVFLSILGLDIRWYAVLILCGALLAFCFSKKDLDECKNINKNDFISDLFLYVLWFGICGARLWYCLFSDIGYYLANPINILKVYDGGLAIHGGVVAGVIVAYIYCKRKNVSFLRVADCVLPNVLVAQAIGRWGNYVNQECHGLEVSESFYDGILFFLKEKMCIGGHYYEPMFFYESVGCIIGFLLIRFILKKTANKRGDLAYGYFLWYGFIRFFIEGRRTDSLYLGPIKMAQLTSIALMVIGILGFLGVFDRLFFKKQKPTVLFDFDGTLADTRACIITPYRELFKKYAKEEDFDEQVQSEVIGPALVDMFAKYFPNEDANQLIEEYRSIQSKMLEGSVKAFPDAKEVLAMLKEEGYHVGIISSRNEASILRIMKIIGLDGLVDDVFGIDQVTKHKPDPEIIYSIIAKNHWNGDDVIVVGDSLADVDCGYNYGAYTIAFISDKLKEETLHNSHANKCINSLSELKGILKSNQYFTYNLK